MTRVALKGLAERRLRTLLTALAIVLGVAMVSGAFTLDRHACAARADSLSTAAYDGTDAVVDAPHRVQGRQRRAAARRRPSPATRPATQVRAVPQVGAAVGDITDAGQDRRQRRQASSATGPYFGVGFDARTPGAAG